MCICLYLSEEVEIKFSDDKAWLVNKEYGTEPLVAHGNGPSKVLAKLLSDQQLRINIHSYFANKDQLAQTKITKNTCFHLAFGTDIHFGWY